MVNGKPVYNIAGKTTSETNHAAIQGILDKDKKLARQLQSIRYGTGETKITAGTFTLKDGSHINQIKFKGDKIEEIFGAEAIPESIRMKKAKTLLLNL